MSPKLHSRIALTGRSGVGKSEVARYLHNTKGFQICSTGAVSRQICNILFGNEEKSNTQALDDALIPRFPALFLNAALRQVDLNGSIVLDSIRFSADLEFAKKNGFRVLRISSDPSIRGERLQKRGQAYDFSKNDGHASETELESFGSIDTIQNDGSTEELFQKIDAHLNLELSDET